MNLTRRACARVAPLLAAALVVTAAAAPARAARAAPSNPFVTAYVNMLAFTVLGAVGLGTDTALGISLGRTGHASLVLSVGNGVIWAGAGYFLLSAIPKGSVNGWVIAVGALCVGSLGFSIYGMAHPTPAVTVAPTVLVGPKGSLVPALSLSGRW